MAGRGTTCSWLGIPGACMNSAHSRRLTTSTDAARPLWCGTTAGFSCSSRATRCRPTKSHELPSRCMPCRGVAVGEPPAPQPIFGEACSPHHRHQPRRLSRCGREETPANVEDEALIALSIEDLIHEPRLCSSRNSEQCG